MKSHSRVAFIALMSFLLLALIPAGPARAQTAEPAPVPSAPEGPDRSGFTLLLTMGVGFQKMDSHLDWKTGLGGLNLGIGGFVSPKVAVMFRFSGTKVRYGSNDNFYREGDVVSGVFGPAVQYWASDSFNFEGGLGAGAISFEHGGSSRAVGAILAAGWSFYHKKKSSLQLGVEYSYVGSSGGAQNFIIAFGWQLL